MTVPFHSAAQDGQQRERGQDTDPDGDEEAGQGAGHVTQSWQTQPTSVTWAIGMPAA